MLKKYPTYQDFFERYIGTWYIAIVYIQLNSWPSLQDNLVTLGSCHSWNSYIAIEPYIANNMGEKHIPLVDAKAIII